MIESVGTSVGQRRTHRSVSPYNYPRRHNSFSATYATVSYSFPRRRLRDAASQHHLQQGMGFFFAVRSITAAESCFTPCREVDNCTSGSGNTKENHELIQQTP